jgi:DNA-binding transcriptional ArsR family regulator
VKISSRLLATDLHRTGWMPVSIVENKLKAMAHEGRRAMLESALTVERSASDLARVGGLSRPAASQHLALLLDAGLMTVRREGRSRWYRADSRALDQLRRDLAVFWTDRIQTLKEAAES